jgi:hypothetical protein
MKRRKNMYTRRRMTIKSLFLLPALLVILFAANATSQLPVPDHVLFVVFENHSYDQVIGSSAAPYINSLVSDSSAALFTQSYGLTHPSQPNYIMLFSGSDQGVKDNNIPNSLPFETPNLGAALLEHGFTFAGYSEDLPSVGFEGKSSGAYARKHNPWVNWQDAKINKVPASCNLPLSYFPSNYDSLPTVSFVIPNQENDMHNGQDPQRISRADTWLKNHLDAYVQWAKSNNSLFIITFDEGHGEKTNNPIGTILSFLQCDNPSEPKNGNHIPTVFMGEMVQHGMWDQEITHYNVLRTIEEMFDLPYMGASADSSAIDYIWKGSTKM